MPIWILESTNAQGKWVVNQPYHIYKKKESAYLALSKLQGYARFLYRVTEYRPVEENNGTH